MTVAALAAETTRVNRNLSRILQQSTLASEVPLRMTLRDIDAGGAPELSPALIRWIGQVCTCGRQAICAVGCRAERPSEHLSACEPACRDDSRFHGSNHRSDPNRLKKALRKVRRLDPKAHDALYCIMVLGMAWHVALAKLNADNLSRGRTEMSEADFLVVTIAGGSLLTAVY